MKQFLLTCLVLCATLQSGLFAQALTQAQTQSRLRQASLVVAELVKDPAAVEVILKGIRSGYYPDESIKFSDLFNTGSSPAFSSVTQAAFANAFRSAMNTGQYYQSNTYGVTAGNPRGDGFNLEGFLTSNNIQIYFPYSDNFTGTALTPAVSYLDFANDEQNTGLLLQKERGTYGEVLINEDYVMANPTFIVNYYEGLTEGTNTGVPGTVEERGGNPPTSGDCMQPPLRMQVNVNEVKFGKQWDGLFRGGPEFRFGRGELNTNGSQVVGGIPPFAAADLKRSHKGGWRAATQPVWDVRWEYQDGVKEELEQFVAVWEEDPETSTTYTFSGTVKANITVPEVGGVESSYSSGVSHTVKSEDAIIYIVQYDRCWFLNTNPVDQGMGMWQGNAVRGTGGNNYVKFTMKVIPW